MSRVAAALRGSLFGELARFGVVGVVALAVDVIGFNLLRFAGGEGPLYDRPLTAKVVSVTASTTVAYLGNRLWTFRHQRTSGTAVHREFALFVLFSAIGSRDRGGLPRHLALRPRLHQPAGGQHRRQRGRARAGHGFRFWSYRRWGFT